MIRGGRAVAFAKTAPPKAAKLVGEDLLHELRASSVSLHEATVVSSALNSKRKESMPW